MPRGIGSVLSFLTILPVPSSLPPPPPPTPSPAPPASSPPATPLEDVARYMYLFPAVGIVIGLLAGSLGLGLSFLVDPLLVGLLVVAFIAIITGIHHADGLADFADGLMAKGTVQQKISAMRDVATGSAGVVATVLCLAGMVASISLAAQDGGLGLLKAVLLSEILAKFSMVLMAGLGSSASRGSSSSPFVRAVGVRGDKGKRLAAAAVIMLVPVLALGQTDGLVMLGAAVAVTLVVLAVSARSFGGITGDVLGATNELARLAALVVYVSV